MQYKSKFALLAIALFGTSALAAPFAGEAEYDVEAREVDNDLSTREFYEMYMEARDLDSDSMDLEAREDLEYLEARQSTTVPMPQTPLTPKVETQGNTGSTGTGTTTTGKKHVFLTKHQKAVRHARLMALQEFEQDPESFHNALVNKDSKYHKFAVLEYLRTPKHLKKAFRNKQSPFHGMAKRLVHQHKAKIYLTSKRHFKSALRHKHNRYHKDAVKLYLSQGNHFAQALSHKDSRFHREAVHEYLLDTKTRMLAIANKDHPFHKQAVALQKKINKHLRKHRKQVDGGYSTANSTTTASPNNA